MSQATASCIAADFNDFRCIHITFGCHFYKGNNFSRIRDASGATLTGEVASYKKGSQDISESDSVTSFLQNFLSSKVEGFHCRNNHKNLEPSCKMDLDI